MLHTDSVAPAHPAVLETSAFEVSFGDSPASQDVALRLTPGRVQALVGESGSGKSVTALALLGLAPAGATVSGQAHLTLGGENTDLLSARTPRAQVRGGLIGTVFQEPMSALNPLMRIGHQLAETLHVHQGSLDRAAVAEKIRTRLSEVGLDDTDRIVRAYPHELSGGQLQRVMIAMAIMNDPPVLIADEPTTALDVTVQAGILRLLRELCDTKNMAVLLITHDMGVVSAIADDVAVMRHGRIVEDGTAPAVLLSPQHDYTRELLASVPRLGSATRTRRPVAPEADTAAHAVAVRDLSVSYGSRRTVVRDVSFDIAPGSTLALVGESGSGKTTIARALSGQIRAQSGTVSIDGVDLNRARGRTRRAALAEIGIVFQDPASSLNPRRPVEWTIAEALAARAIPAGEHARRVRELLDRVSLPAEFAERYPHELSGGQRQRIGIARAIALEPTLLIADEPTSALDVTVQARILDLFAELQADLGFASLFISHDLAVVEQVADEIAVLYDGSIVEHGSAAEVLRNPRDAYTQRLLASVPVIAGSPTNR